MVVSRSLPRLLASRVKQGLELLSPLSQRISSVETSIWELQHSRWPMLMIYSLALLSRTSQLTVLMPCLVANPSLRTTTPSPSSTSAHLQPIRCQQSCRINPFPDRCKRHLLAVLTISSEVHRANLVPSLHQTYLTYEQSKAI